MGLEEIMKAVDKLCWIAKYHWNITKSTYIRDPPISRCEIIRENVDIESASYCLDTINMSYNRDKVSYALVKISQTKNRCAVKDAADCFRRYPENTQLLYDILQQSHAEKLQLMYLASDKAFEAVNKAKNPKKMIIDILDGKYYNIGNCMLNDIDHYKISTHIFETLDWVLDLHNGRTNSNKRRIQIGFFNELERAIEENGTQIIKQYCREVRAKIKKNADELMVITNG